MENSEAKRRKEISKLILISCMVLFFGGYSCTSTNEAQHVDKYEVGQKYYFRYVDLKQGPNCLFDRISEEETAYYGSYFEVLFNEEGLVCLLTAISREFGFVWSAGYEYYDTGNIRKKIWTDGGNIHISYFSREGGIVREEW